LTVRSSRVTAQRDIGSCFGYSSRDMKKRTTTLRSAGWRKDWEPIFRAAREGRLPNRLGGVLEMMMCQCALRKYREERRAAVGKS
jgi:hypothetical protein